VRSVVGFCILKSKIQLLSVDLKYTHEVLFSEQSSTKRDVQRPVSTHLQQSLHQATNACQSVRPSQDEYTEVASDTHDDES